jgi:hypothetical protein
MANELSHTLSISYAKGTPSDIVTRTESTTTTISGTMWQAGRQTIGTSEESLQKGDVGTVGYVYIRNMDATNYVEIGTTSGQYSIKLPAGKDCWFFANGNTIYAKANTASVAVAYTIFEA